MHEFKKGLTGNQLLEYILSSAREAGVPSPIIFSHSLGLFLHEPGPVIGLPWEQDPFPGRGEVNLEGEPASRFPLPTFAVLSASLSRAGHEPRPPTKGAYPLGFPDERFPAASHGAYAPLVKLEYNSSYAMELAIVDTVPVWDKERVGCQTEQIVQFTEDGCKPVDSVQTHFHLI